MSNQTPDYKAVQKMIKQAVILRAAKISSRSISEKIKPFQEMTDSVSTQLYELLRKDDEGYNDWGSRLWEYKNLLQQMLILLAKPGVLSLLPQHFQEKAADMLDNLIDFFHFIDHDDTHALLDYERCSYIHNNPEELQRILDYYDFDKRREHEHNSHYFGDLAREEEWEQNAIAYKNEHFVGK